MHWTIHFENMTGRSTHGFFRCTSACFIIKQFYIFFYINRSAMTSLRRIAVFALFGKIYHNLFQLCSLFSQLACIALMTDIAYNPVAF